MGEGTVFSLSVHTLTGGSEVSDFWGGPRSQIFGGVLGLRFSGGYLVSDFWGGPGSQILGGVPGLSKGKIF